MKNLFFTATAVLALLCSCSKEESTQISNPTDNNMVSISLVADDTHFRAFSDASASAETWEKSLSSLTIYAFNTSGKLLVERHFTSSELSAKSASFALPGATAGDNCDFYAVANISIASVIDKAALLAALESSAVSYNGTFAQVSTSAKRAEGFVMSGNLTKAIAAAAESTSVAITLKRTVAKVAIEVTTSADFADKYSGDIRINSAKIVGAASQSPVIKPATPNTGAMSYTHTQSSNSSSGKFQNLFYIFENGALAAGSRVAVELDATYDQDGNFATTTDQAQMSYRVELEGSAAGAIARNGYYRLEVSISGLSGDEVSISVIVADWESPVTQSVNIGS